MVINSNMLSLRKCIPNAFDNIDGHGIVGGVMLRPVRLSIKKQLKLSKDLLSSGSKSLITSCEKLFGNDVTIVNNMSTKLTKVIA